MKAEELMIGDWVYYGNAQVRVLQLSEGAEYKQVAPIHITPEIIEKNGFVPYEEDGESFHGDDCVFLKQSLGGYGVCVDKNRTISGLFHYVHELQHAFRLAGIEKEIIL